MYLEKKPAPRRWIWLLLLLARACALGREHLGLEGPPARRRAAVRGPLILSRPGVSDVAEHMPRQDMPRLLLDPAQEAGLPPHQLPAEASRVPVINGGDGDNEHPSQALLDLFTIKKELESHNKKLDTVRIALIGDLKFGRAAHSLCKILMLYTNISIKLVSPDKLRLPDFLINEFKKNNISILETQDIKEGIADVDIIYMTRIQEERFKNVSEANKYKGLMSLNQEIYTKNCEPNTIIMHPLPRDSRKDANELDDDLNQNPNLAIYRQTDNGLLIRMALFCLILGVTDKIEDTASSVDWFSNKS